MKNYTAFTIALLIGILANAQTPTTDSTTSINEVVTANQVEWGWLNPLRGDKSPAAGKLWGDRTSTNASGFLVKFKKGFSSPAHIHNVTYRGMVISGLLHNDDEKAEEMWLPKGSFWVQPAGEAHITAASGEANLVYIEIQEGPYLVKPTSEAFDNGERPVNIDKSNLVWLNAKDITWIKNDSGIQTAFLWGTHENEQLRASLIKLPKGFQGKIKNLSPNFRAVIIDGNLTHSITKDAKHSTLQSGSYFGAAKDSVHRVEALEETTIYIRSNGSFKITSK